MNASDKHTLIMTWLDRGMIAIGIDNTHAGVVVPPFLSGQIQIVLNLSYRFAPMNAKVDAEKLAVDLLFGSTIFRCVIPFDAVFALKPGGDKSKEEWIDFDFVKTTAAPVEPKKQRPSWLKVVPPSASEDEQLTEEDEGPKSA